ncbi:hypothetical protein GCM10023168_30850 [Fodinibacter luteus]|uniref:Uncharacterized protein n=1 Tax=Fodinibacter luteus TaxID=552064 RepID=A0ABP8KN08_9MICO
MWPSTNIDGHSTVTGPLPTIRTWRAPSRVRTDMADRPADVLVGVLVVVDIVGLLSSCRIY